MKREPRRGLQLGISADIHLSREIMDFFCVRLPFLHPRLNRDTVPARYLCPGVSVADETVFWRPDDYPYSEAEATAILHEFRNLDVAELESMHTRLTGPALASEIRRHDERAALAAFSGMPAPDSATELLRQHAHKMLLWLWAMEENLAEIRNLEIACRNAEAALQNSFEDNSQVALDTAAAQAPETDSMLPWHACVASACWFIEPGTPVFVEGAMLRDLADTLEFEPAPGLWEGGTLLRATAPLWRVLRHSRPVEEECARSVYNTERVWLGLNND